MTIVTTPTDPTAAVIDMLTGRLAPGFPTLQVRSTVPKKWIATAGAAPLLIVEHDGTTGGEQWPVALTTTIRLTTYTPDPDEEPLLTALAAALGVPIPGVARARAGMWPIKATDSTTKAHLHSATVLLTARTTEKEI